MLGARDDCECSQSGLAGSFNSLYLGNRTECRWHSIKPACSAQPWRDSTSDSSVRNSPAFGLSGRCGKDRVQAPSFTRSVGAGSGTPTPPVRRYLLTSVCTCPSSLSQVNKGKGVKKWYAEVWRWAGRAPPPADARHFLYGPQCDAALCATPIDSTRRRNAFHPLCGC